MDILRAQQNAKDRMLRHQPLGGLVVNGHKLKWIDPYYGFLELPYEKGMARVKEVEEVFGDNVEEFIEE